MSDTVDLRATIGRVGVWSFALDRYPANEERDLVAEIEDLGFPALWIPEGLGSKEALSHAGLILETTRRVVVATGIASIWARDPVAMMNGGRMLGEAFSGRFVLGVGVSHRTTVDRRGAFTYARPYTHMAHYLDAMDQARYPARPVPPAPPLLLAALGPRMLALASERADGAHPYFVPVEHTTKAREALGTGPLLAPELAAVLEPDPETARGIARDYMQHYLKLENYANNLRRLGWEQSDIDGPTDALVDAIVAWGDQDAIIRRVRDHLDAGADHVSVQVLGPDPAKLAIEQLRSLAPALLEA
jgi:probable F420-dependent oxidoreductase